MYAEVKTMLIRGVDGLLVNVEAHLNKGLHKFSIVGLPDRAVSEAKERVLGAMQNSGISIPYGHLLVNLNPAHIVKTGTACDLPVAAALMLLNENLAAANKLDLNAYGLIGELSLTGDLVVPDGWVGLVQEASKLGLKGLVGPKLEIVPPGLDYVAIGSLKELEKLIFSGRDNFQRGETGIVGLGNITGQQNPQLAPTTISHSSIVSKLAARKQPEGSLEAIAALRSSSLAERLVLISAAGGHSLLLDGTPGTGKTTFLTVLDQISPQLTESQAWEIAKLYQLAGQQLPGDRPPLRQPHHSASRAAILGGGSTPTPGEVSLAHHGYLLLDEVAEFSRETLEALRQPLIDGKVHITRVGYKVTFPARFTLLATRNGCPCGWYGDPSGRCSCNHLQVSAYQKRLSGALLDRIDLKFRFDSPLGKFGVDPNTSQSVPDYLESLRAKVETARSIQQQRWLAFDSGKQDKSNLLLNAHFGNPFDLSMLKITPKALSVSSKSIHNISHRTRFKIIKIARTIADLDGSHWVTQDHLAEAAAYNG